MKIGRLFAACALLLALLATSRGALAQSAPIVELQYLTTREVEARLAEGWTTIIVPTGGTEQNGPHLVLGKHNIVVGHTAVAIARALDRTLVAPVMAYVPEGRIDPPEGHMRYAGTISLSPAIFEAVLEATARSFIAAGFKTVLFIGDSGGNQESQANVAARLDAAHSGTGVHVFAIDEYYSANGQAAWLRADGESEAAIGGHAGIRETSELLAIDPAMVRRDLLVATTDWSGLGASGQPERSSVERGRRLLALKVEAALRQIRRLTGLAQ